MSEHENELLGAYVLGVLEPDERSTVVTAIELPGDIDGGKVPGTLRKLGITANGGQYFASCWHISLTIPTSIT